MSRVSSRREPKPAERRRSARWPAVMVGLLAATAGAGHGLAAPAVSAPEAFMRPFQGTGKKQGGFKAIIVCFDPQRAGQARPLYYGEAGSLLWGDDGGPSIADWFKKNSRNTFNLEWTITRGCNGPGSSYRPPAAHPAANDGNWYWTEKRWDLMWNHALQAATAEVDFSQWDANGDRRITPDELVVIVAVPQADPYGTFRPGLATATVNGRTMTFDIVDMYVNPDSGKRRLNIGIMAHEISHAVAKTDDMYEWLHFDTARQTWIPVLHANPGLYSIMDDHSQASYLDPYHRLKLNWVYPFVWNVTTGVRQLRLVPVSDGGTVHVLQEPLKGTTEYFILENRTAQAPRYGGVNYDSAVPVSGPVLWHIVEDLSMAYHRPHPGHELWNWKLNGTSWGRTVVRFTWACGNSPNTPFRLRWSDGRSVGTQVVCRGGDGAGNQIVDVERAP